MKKTSKVTADLNHTIQFIERVFEDWKEECLCDNINHHFNPDSVKKMREYADTLAFLLYLKKYMKFMPISKNRDIHIDNRFRKQPALSEEQLYYYENLSHLAR